MKFTERFNIEVGLDDARRRFVNRIHNEIFSAFLFGAHFRDDFRHYLYRTVATHLGDRFRNSALTNTVGDEFHRNLRAVEGIYINLSDTNARKRLDKLVVDLLAASEIDIGIQWRDGSFYPTGAGSSTNAS
jgi:hypothetical protein